MASSGVFLQALRGSSVGTGGCGLSKAILDAIDLNSYRVAGDVEDSAAGRGRRERPSVQARAQSFVLEAWASQGPLIVSAMSEQPDHGTPERTASHPHDKYFRSVFSNPEDAASLLRAYVPQSLGRTLKWATLTMLPGRFVSADWRGSEADLLFSVEPEATDTPVLLYVLLEHQSSPDRWMRTRIAAAADRTAGVLPGSGPVAA